jgi:hypothetical protein
MTATEYFTCQKCGVVLIQWNLESDCVRWDLGTNLRLCNPCWFATEPNSRQHEKEPGRKRNNP